MQEETFKIDGEYIELLKLLKATGICATGGEAKFMVDDGRVTVDGAVEFRKRCKIRKGQTVNVEGYRIEIR